MLASFRMNCYIAQLLLKLLQIGRVSLSELSALFTAFI